MPHLIRASLTNRTILKLSTVHFTTIHWQLPNSKLKSPNTLVLRFWNHVVGTGAGPHMAAQNLLHKLQPKLMAM
jgi:hypothetical protein